MTTIPPPGLPPFSTRARSRSSGSPRRTGASKLRRLNRRARTRHRATSRSARKRPSTDFRGKKAKATAREATNRTGRQPPGNQQEKKPGCSGRGARADTEGMHAESRSATHVHPPGAGKELAPHHALPYSQTVRTVEMRRSQQLRAERSIDHREHAHMRVRPPHRPGHGRGAPKEKNSRRILRAADEPRGAFCF